MEVKVYTTSTCPYCTMVKEFLSQNDVSFEERRVDDTRRNQRRVHPFGRGDGSACHRHRRRTGGRIDREKIRALLESK